MALSAMVADCCVFVGALEWIQKYIHILKWKWRCCGKRVVLDTLNLVSFVVLRLICFGLQGLAMFHSCLTPWTKYETTLTWFHFWGGGCQIMVLRSDVEHLLRAGKALRKQRCLNFSWLEETCHDRWSRSDPKWMGVVHHFVVCLRHCWNDCYLHWGENPLHWCGGWLLKWSMGLTLGIQWSWHFKRAVDGANKTCANGLTKNCLTFSWWPDWCPKCWCGHWESQDVSRGHDLAMGMCLPCCQKELSWCGLTISSLTVEQQDLYTWSELRWHVGRRL